MRNFAILIAAAAALAACTDPTAQMRAAAVSACVAQSGGTQGECTCAIDHVARGMGPEAFNAFVKVGVLQQPATPEDTAILSQPGVRESAMTAFQQADAVCKSK